jgi:hypothetical protein
LIPLFSRSNPVPGKILRREELQKIGKDISKAL